MYSSPFATEVFYFVGQTARLCVGERGHMREIGAEPATVMDEVKQSLFPTFLLPLATGGRSGAGGPLQLVTAV